MSVEMPPKISVFSIFRIFLFGVCLACIPLVLAVGENQTALLWRIETNAESGLIPNYIPSYVLGTIHSADERILKLPTQVQQAFNKADSFTAEIKMEPATLLKANLSMFLSGKKSLDELVDKSVFQQCVNLLDDYGIPELLVKKMKPWAVAVTLSMPKASGQFLDLFMYREAKAAGKKLYGLESVDEQMSLFDDMPLKLQITMLNEAIAQHADSQKMIELLTKAYLNRNLTEIYELSYGFMEQSDPELVKVIDTEVIIKRNLRMLERMLPILKEGNAFIAVGALHLPGEKGLLQLLRQRGFKPVPVY
ncbi:MAG: TraB/GumN family protein [Gammaproteobacteria bacterium]|nr:TraB/GumN family protein [Gammaproteobacteria bacterium]